jgi:hypothetical protein
VTATTAGAPGRRPGEADGAAPVAHRVTVFAAEDTSLQLTWSALGPGPVRARAADTTVDLLADGGPAGVVLAGLPPEEAVEVRLTGEGVPGGRLSIATRTLPSPPGEELYRLGTISDTHLGSVGFGYRRTIVEDDRPVVPHPVRCAAAAIADLVAWGAQRLVVKGDITEQSDIWNWRTFGRLVAGLDIPVDVLAGNHDYGSRRTIDPVDGLRSVGLGLRQGVESVALPGLRLVLVDSTEPDRHHGRLALRTDAVVAALHGVREGALVAMHHHLQPHTLTEGWPWGVPKQESRGFLDAVGGAHPRTLVTSGHTHRHRRWQRGPVTVTQVGSTKDYPGVWAGYVVHEGGIRQVVRRVTAPDCISWTERTRKAAFGLWAVAAPGRLSDRCFTLDWSDPPAAG